jgi:hypothetical protein
MDTSVSSMSYTYSACNRCIATTTNFTSGPAQVSTIGRDSWQNEWAVEQKPVVKQGGAWVNPLPTMPFENLPCPPYSDPPTMRVPLAAGRGWETLDHEANQAFGGTDREQAA